MAVNREVKAASKNDPTKRQKARQKMYKDKPVKPVRYINRDLRINYMAAECSNGSLVQDESGNPIKWKAV